MRIAMLSLSGINSKNPCADFDFCTRVIKAVKVVLPLVENSFCLSKLGGRVGDKLGTDCRSSYRNKSKLVQ